MSEIRNEDGSLSKSPFRQDEWQPVPREAPSALLNGAEPVRALLLYNPFEFLLVKDRSLMLHTLLSAESEVDPELIETAFMDYRVPVSSAALRGAHVATRVCIDGKPFTEARLAALPHDSRAVINICRRSQVLHALKTVVAEAWVGGFLFLRRFAAALLPADLVADMDSIASDLEALRDSIPTCTFRNLIPRVAAPVALPPLPIPFCAGCHEVILAGCSCCSRCMMVLYHDAVCQRRHWDAGHKAECRKQPGRGHPLFLRRMVTAETAVAAAMAELEAETASIHQTMR